MDLCLKKMEGFQPNQRASSQEQYHWYNWYFIKGIGKMGSRKQIKYQLYDTVDDIHACSTYVEKYKILKFGEHTHLDVRIKFIKDVLIGRLHWQINGWEIMEYNLRFQVICNRLLKELNIMV
jgi:hypothetical protein